MARKAGTERERKREAREWIGELEQRELITAIHRLLRSLRSALADYSANGEQQLVGTRERELVEPRTSMVSMVSTLESHGMLDFSIVKSPRGVGIGYGHRDTLDLFHRGNLRSMDPRMYEESRSYAECRIYAEHWIYVEPRGYGEPRIYAELRNYVEPRVYAALRIYVELRMHAKIGAMLNVGSVQNLRSM